MVRIMFVCHGNICRSTMSEFVMKHLVQQAGIADKVYIASSATSYEAIGCDIHRGTKAVLDEHGIPYTKRAAVRLEKSDFDKYDYFIGMDDENIHDMKRILGTIRKIHKLLEFAGENRSISDPWYTGDFNKTYEDVCLGCEALLKKILEQV